MSEAINAAIETILDGILKAEGGYVDDPSDAGGATNHGVSLRYAKGKPLAELDLDHDGDIDKHDIRLVTIELARSLYKEDFFYNPGLNRFPAEFHAQLFDISVNAGGSRAVALLQRALGALSYPVATDGQIGPKTLSELLRAIARYGVKRVNNEIVTQRIAFYEDIIRRKPSQVRFHDGWMSRARGFLI